MSTRKPTSSPLVTLAVESRPVTNTPRDERSHTVMAGPRGVVDPQDARRTIDVPAGGGRA